MSCRGEVNSKKAAIRNPGVITKQRPHSDTASRTSRPHTKKQENYGENGPLYRAILDKAQEKDPRKVFDIDLSIQKLAKIPNLRQFSKARILDLSCNGISSISGLENLNELRELKLYSNKIAEITGLEKNKELQILLLQHNHIKAIGKGLQHGRKLKILRLDSNLLSSIDHLEISGCADLNVLDISNNTITDLSAINSLTALEELDVSANTLIKITDISRCRHLQELDLSRNKINDLSGLKGLTNLTVIHLENNTLTSLVSIGKQKKLQELYASHNKISSLMGIAQQFPTLEVLNLCYNAIGALDELLNVKQSSLVELFVTGNPCISNDIPTDYPQLIHQMIPSVELVDGVSLKRPASSTKTKPLMRPMSAYQVLSSRQIEEQLRTAVFEQSSYEESITRRFGTVKSLFDSLPKEKPITLFNKDTLIAEQKREATDQSRPVSRCSNRSRIAEAQMFATENFYEEQD